MFSYRCCCPRGSSCLLRPVHRPASPRWLSWGGQPRNAGDSYPNLTVHRKALGPRLGLSARKSRWESLVLTFTLYLSRPLHLRLEADPSLPPPPCDWQGGATRELSYVEVQALTQPRSEVAGLAGVSGRLCYRKSFDKSQAGLSNFYCSAELCKSLNTL